MRDALALTDLSTRIVGGDTLLEARVVRGRTG